MELVLQRYSWVGTALAAVLGAYLCARIVNTVAATAIAPKPALLQQSVAASQRAAPIAPRTELDAERLAKSFDLPLPKPASEAAAEPQQKSWNETPVRSSLRATLVGTALANPARYSLCQLTNGDTNETLVYAIGDKFMGARIYAIEKDRVLLDNDGHNEFIDNSAAAAPNLGFTPMPAQPGVPAQADNSVRQLSDNQYVLSKNTVNSALSDLSQLATQARIVPSFKNGVANGFKLFSIQPGSLYSAIGVENGDVIQRINGYEINSPDKALEVYQKLRDANRIEVEIERRGETIRKSYSIE